MVLRSKPHLVCIAISLARESDGRRIDLPPNSVPVVMRVGTMFSFTGFSSSVLSGGEEAGRFGGRAPKSRECGGELRRCFVSQTAMGTVVIVLALPGGGQCLSFGQVRKRLCIQQLVS